MSPDRLLDRQLLERPFGLLADKLRRRGVVGELHVFGGAAWLNNQASSYVSGRAGRGTPVYDHPHLRVMTTPPEHLLAMKVRAARSVRDADDIRLLLDTLQLGTMDEVVEVVERYFPDEPLSDRSRLLVEDLLDQQA